jgi:hypothetical protein
MKSGLKAVFTLTAVVLVALGSGLLLVPNGMAALYGAVVSTGGTNSGRIAGAAIIALGLLAWLSRKQELGKAAAVSIPVLFVWFVLKSAVAWLGVRDEVFNPVVGRTILFFDVLLAVIYGYYLWASFRREPRRDGH